MSYYHNRVRLVNHLLQSSARCKDYYQTYVPPISEDDYLMFEQEDLEMTKTLQGKGYRRNKSYKRPLRTYGPHTVEAFRLGIGHGKHVFKLTGREKAQLLRLTNP